MKKNYLSVILSSFVLGIILIFIFQRLKSPASSKGKERIKATQFVQKQLIDSQGLLETYPYLAQTIPYRPDYIREALSESAGLWMQILALTNNQKEFERQVSSLNRFFLLPDNSLSWRLAIQKEDKVVPDSVSATIDDLRVVRALLEMNQHKANPAYVQLAKKLADSMKKNAVYQDFLLHKPMSTEERSGGPWIVILSYLDLNAMEALISVDPQWKPIYEKALTLLIKGLRSNGFFYDRYDVGKDLYYDEEKNMINYILCAIYLAERGFSVETFMGFLTTQWQKYGRLYGKYDGETLKPLVDYESIAVYALTMRLALVMKQTDFADKIRHRVLKLASEQKNPLWKGALCEDACHAFDHLQALLTIIMDNQN